MALYMAHFELHPPGEAENLRAARQAYYAANQFAKPVKFNALKREFLPQVVNVKRVEDKTAFDFFNEMTPMPDHVRSRFH